MDIIPKSLDKALDKANPGENLQAGISIRNGPLQEMDIDEPSLKDAKTNGNVSGKRKSRPSNGKSYKDVSSEDDGDDKPLVRLVFEDEDRSGRC